MGQYAGRATSTCLLLFGIRLLGNFSALVSLVNGSPTGKLVGSKIASSVSMKKSALHVRHSCETEIIVASVATLEDVPT